MESISSYGETRQSLLKRLGSKLEAVLALGSALFRKQSMTQ